MHIAMSAYLRTGSLDNLITAAYEYAAINNQISITRARRIVIKAVRQVEHRQRQCHTADMTDRAIRVTTDEYKNTSYSDPTGDQAVRQIMKALSVA